MSEPLLMSQAFRLVPGRPTGSPPSCPRCHGPSLTLERAGGVGEGESVTRTLIRCLACGDRFDRVMLDRRRGVLAKPNLRRGPNHRWDGQAVSAVTHPEG